MQRFERRKRPLVEMIKIDGSFVRNVAEDGQAVRWSRSAWPQPGPALTLAELVEEAHPPRWLHEPGVDCGQADLISQPLRGALLAAPG